ncbi:MAG: F0F1 ATP synthase subunit delta [Xanthomonadales bacterium]|jgi:F-type H+-transporting ATPase subunit delta|nr:F0F1 ATP synthase subunit delta [Xanthomonadales bacterium]
MSSLTTLARPYAKAAFELAQGENALAGWNDMLRLASDIVVEESMAALLESPDVSNSDAVKIITDVAGEAFVGRFRDYLAVLAANGRLPLLPHINELYRALRDEAESRLSVKVVSAIPLDEDQSSRMKQALAQRFECEIELENEVDTEIIGGAVVYAGDQVIDGSLRGRLQKLSNSLAN